MHCEQNFAKNILKTVTGEKDTMKMRRDLQHKGMKKHLWLAINPQRGGKMLKPTTPYALIPSGFDIFVTIIENLQTPSGHVSVMGQYIRKKNFEGLKSHEYHVLMQQFLLLTLRGLLTVGLRMAVMKISKIFR